MPETITAAVQDYVKAIYTLEPGSGGPVTTTALAERLDVRPASVSGMLPKLTQLGLVEHEPYRGVRLTERGTRPGAELEVVDRQPFDGPLYVRVGDDVHVLGAVLARAMRVAA